MFVTYLAAAASLGQAQVAAEPGGRQPAVPWSSYTQSYITALWAVDNYRSCGSGARAIVVTALREELERLESHGGYFPETTKAEEDYQTNSGKFYCIGGAIVGLAAARQSIRAFRRQAELVREQMTPDLPVSMR